MKLFNSCISMGVVLSHERLARAAVIAQGGLHVAGDDIKA